MTRTDAPLSPEGTRPRPSPWSRASRPPRGSRAAVAAAFVAAWLGLAGRAGAQPAAPAAGEGIALPADRALDPASAVRRAEIEALLGELELGAKDAGAVRDILDRAEREQVRLRADREIAAIDLRREAAKDPASEARISALVRRVAGLDGELRASQVATWLRLRRLLPADKRARLDGVAPVARIRSEVMPIEPSWSVDGPLPPYDRQTDGYLSVNTKPYSTVFVDGVKVGVTPLIRVSLSPGRRVIRAVTADGQERTVSIVVEAGNEVRWVYDW